MKCGRCREFQATKKELNSKGRTGLCNASKRSVYELDECSNMTFPICQPYKWIQTDPEVAEIMALRYDKNFPGRLIKFVNGQELVHQKHKEYYVGKQKILNGNYIFRDATDGKLYIEDAEEFERTHTMKR